LVADAPATNDSIAALRIGLENRHHRLGELALAEASTRAQPVDQLTEREVGEFANVWSRSSMLRS
jgi:hypothetical protein